VSLLIVSYGGGVNSTAMLFQMAKLRMPIDLIMFADTGVEWPETYEHVRLADHRFQTVLGTPPMTRVAYKETIEDGCLRRATLPSVAFGFGRHACGHKYKIYPQEKYAKAWGPYKQAIARGEEVRWAFGFDAKETKRKAKVPRGVTPIYPLREWNWDRAACIDACREFGLMPRKSSCWCCPAMKKPDILELAEKHPDLLERALRIEDNALPSLKKIKGLGSRFNWREFIAGAEERAERRKVGAE